ncbi:hypothetical protein MN608_09758 [Microdochium nivale]|nr:hypothetical protein MN608_09758 [Microdochium nivale]
MRALRLYTKLLATSLTTPAQRLPPRLLHPRAMSSSSSTNNNHNNNHNNSSSSENPAANKQPLPLPGPSSSSSSSSGATTTLTVDGEGVRLDHLGPLVVNVDGTMSRISNWDKMAAIERDNTLRIIGKRNQTRLAALRAAADKVVATAAATEGGQQQDITAKDN